MSRLIDRERVIADSWIVVEDDVADSAGPGDEAGAATATAPTGLEGGADYLLGLARWQAEPARWRAHDGRIGVLLEPADDPAALADALDALSLIAIRFPRFTDGRGYSSARLLREAHGWHGELRAVGDVLLDQLYLMSRCGFDTFALRDDQPAETAFARFRTFSASYQPAADSIDTIMRRRFAARGSA